MTLRLSGLWDERTIESLKLIGPSIYRRVATLDTYLREATTKVSTPSQRHWQKVSTRDEMLANSVPYRGCHTTALKQLCLLQVVAFRTRRQHIYKHRFCYFMPPSLFGYSALYRLKIGSGQDVLSSAGCLLCLPVSQNRSIRFQSEGLSGQLHRPWK